MIVGGAAGLVVGEALIHCFAPCFAEPLRGGLKLENAALAGCLQSVGEQLSAVRRIQVHFGVGVGGQNMTQDVAQGGNKA